MSTELPLVVLGGGGHARVVAELAHSLGRDVHGWIGPDPEQRFPGVARLGDDSAFERLDPSRVLLVNGVGSVADLGSRARVYAAARARGFQFATLVAPSAHVSPTAVLGAGTQVLAAAVIGSGVRTGVDTIVNTAAVIDHDTDLGDHVHVSPGAVLAGGIRVGARTHVGLGSRIIQGVRIGSDCTIGAGSVVLADVPDGSLAVGVPATHRPR